MLNFINTDAPMVSLMNFREACRNGDVQQINLLLLNGYQDFINDGLFYACEMANVKVLHFLIERGATNWDGVLVGACKGGHMNIVQWIISKAERKLDWNSGLALACEAGNIDIIKLMISKGANNWDHGLYRACYAGNAEVAKFMILNGANNWNTCFYHYGHQLSIMKVLTDHGANCMYYTWPHDAKQISELLYLGVPLHKFQKIVSYKELTRHIQTFKTKVLEAKTLLPDLLNIVLQCSFI